VVATYAFVARLVDRRAGLFSAIALATMPLFFVQARTMLGDVVTMTSVAVAFGGLLVGAFDRTDEDAKLSPSRIAWVVLGIGACDRLARRDSRRRMCRRLGGNRVGRLVAAEDARATPATDGALPARPRCIRACKRWDRPDARHRGGRDHESAHEISDVRHGHRLAGHALAPWSSRRSFGRLILAPVGRHGAANQRELRALALSSARPSRSRRTRTSARPTSSRSRACLIAAAASRFGISIAGALFVAVGVGIAVLLASSTTTPRCQRRTKPRRPRRRSRLKDTSPSF
jgi:hypothetical protein